MVRSLNFVCVSFQLSWSFLVPVVCSRGDSSSTDAQGGRSSFTRNVEPTWITLPQSRVLLSFRLSHFPVHVPLDTRGTVGVRGRTVPFPVRRNGSYLRGPPVSFGPRGPGRRQVLILPFLSFPVVWVRGLRSRSFPLGSPDHPPSVRDGKRPSTLHTRTLLYHYIPCLFQQEPEDSPESSPSRVPRRVSVVTYGTSPVPNLIGLGSVSHSPSEVTHDLGPRLSRRSVKTLESPSVFVVEGTPPRHVPGGLGHS